MNESLMALDGPKTAGDSEFCDGLPLELQHHADKAPATWWATAWSYVNFYRAHFLYFVVTVILATFILWLSPSTAEGKLSFIDALMSATSAMTCSGLTPVTMATFSTFNQCIILLLMLLGGQIFTSLLPVLIRMYYFHRTIKEMEVKFEESRQVKLARLAADDSVNLEPTAVPAIIEDQNLRTIKEYTPLSRGPSTGFLNRMNGAEEVGEVSKVDRTVTVTSPQAELSEIISEFHGDIKSEGEAMMAAAALSEATRKAVGVKDPSSLSSTTWSGETAKTQATRFKLALQIYAEKQRVAREDSLNEVGLNREKFPHNSSLAESLPEGSSSPLYSLDMRTMEYRALKTLSWLVPCYWLGIQALAFLIVRANFLMSASQREVLDSFSINHTFYSAFMVVSAFQNVGYSLIDSSLVEFQTAIFYLTVLGVLILLGNTMYAPTMRGIIYLMHRLAGPQASDQYGLQYLLDHPRKCFTHLFPFHQTLWLVVSVISINAVELFFYCILDWNTESLSNLSGGYRFFDGLIQSLNTRSSGLSVVSIGALSPAMLVLYLGMMYVAVYPVYLSRQTSKEAKEVVLQRSASDAADSQYNEQQVGLFNEQDVEGNDVRLAVQARKLIARDSALIFFAIFTISIIEASNIRKDANFNLFSIIFESISAYGNVGLSLGYTCLNQPCTSPPYSFSGTWSPLAKLVLCLVMLMGRHRGLPESIDAAVKLPAKHFFRKDVIVKEASFRYPNELVDPVEKVMLLRAEKQKSTNIFQSISDRVSGISSESTPRSLSRRTSFLV